MAISSLAALGELHEAQPATERIGEVGDLSVAGQVRRCAAPGYGTVPARGVLEQADRRLPAEHLGHRFALEPAPLVDHETIVQLIGATRTRTTAGLRVRAKLDEGAFPKGVEVTDEELAEVNLINDAFHGEWNYTIAPRRRRQS